MLYLVIWKSLVKSSLSVDKMRSDLNTAMLICYCVVYLTLARSLESGTSNNHLSADSSELIRSCLLRVYAEEGRVWEGGECDA